MSRELDARVAKALGLDVKGWIPAYRDPEVPGRWDVELWGDTQNSEMHPGYVDHCTCDVAEEDQKTSPFPVFRMLGHFAYCFEIVLHYSIDIAASRTMEDWIEEHDLKDRYLQGMMDVLRHDKQDGRNNRLGWDLLHATPEQRCRAFLKARGNDGTD